MASSITLDDRDLETVWARLDAKDFSFEDVEARSRARAVSRQPVHTVYGGAHLFSSTTTQKLGRIALAMLDEYAPDWPTFARVLGLDAAGSNEVVSREVYLRVVEKLRREPVEDYRVDFEDGYGVRTDEEEDAHAVSSAREVSAGIASRSLPPFFGLRIKPLDRAFARRAARTLDLFVTALLDASDGELPERFVVTLPKVTRSSQVEALVVLLETLEKKRGIARGLLKLELMVEHPEAIVDSTGRCPLPLFVEAARGRCVGAHFGTYDYSAACDIAAAHQSMRHPSCEFAKHVMQAALAGSGVMLSDGATTTLPVAKHRVGPGKSELSSIEADENRAGIHRAWKLHFDDVRHSLRGGFYQGWDLHPGQLPSRHAAVCSFFIEEVGLATRRMRAFLDKAAQATRVGDVFDDAATGQGLLNFFLRGVSCGALTEDQALAAGVTRDMLSSRTFSLRAPRRA